MLMHWSSNSIARILTSISELKKRCSVQCDNLKKDSLNGVPIVANVEKTQANGTLAAVDSGFSTKQFLSMDVMLLRSVSTIFTYENCKLASTDYFPNRVPGISIHYGVFSDQSESTCFKSLTRLNAEISCAVQTVNVFKPSMLLIDGSLLPLPSDKPPENSSLSLLYSETIALYSDLFKACAENNCELVGVCKDSRSQRLCNLLSENNKVDFPIPNDEFVTDLLLDPFQRTLCFSHSNAPNNAGAVSDVPWSELVNCFYMKAGDSLPFRVEFILPNANNEKENNGKENLEKAASLIASSLASFCSPQFGYPSILIEVDMRASLKPGEISTLFASLEHQANALILRSNSRPFR